MPSKLLTMPAELASFDTFGVVSDFPCYVTADEFTTVASDSGTVSVADAVGGILAIVPSDNTVGDNDESYAKSTTEIFKFAANKPIVFVCRAQFTEANTDDANVVLGIANAVAANYAQDNGGGPPSSYYGFNVHKVDGGTAWICECSMGSTQNTTTSTQSAGGSSYQSFKIVAHPDTSTQLRVSYFCDPAGGDAFQPMLSATDGKPIVHLITIASATEMQIGVGVKNGGTNLETLNVDLVGCWQGR